MINEVLVPILVLLANVITTVVIVQFILGLLISFNVVSYQNQLVSALWTALNAILDPILAPINRRLPNTGGIDFSPIVLLLLIQVAIIILSYVGRPVGGARLGARRLAQVPQHLVQRVLGHDARHDAQRRERHRIQRRHSTA